MSDSTEGWADTEDLIHRQVAPIVGQALQQFLGKPLNGSSYEAIRTVLYDACVSVRLRTGVRLPRLVAVAIPTRGRLLITRQDLDHQGIQRLMLGLIKEFQENPKEPDLTVDELHDAIRRAFPSYNPDHGRALSVAESHTVQ